MKRVLWALLAPLAVSLLALATPTTAEAQSYIGMNTNSSITLTLVVYDQWGNPMCCLPLSLSGQPAQELGGHNHSLTVGGIRYRFARLSPTTCNTGSNAFGCRVTIESLAAAGGFDTVATVTSGPHAGFTFVANPGVMIGAYQGDNLSRFEWYGIPGTYVQIGNTNPQPHPHPENHWCLYWFCDGAALLAYDYNATWGLVLAYNDMSLQKGGLFDINAAWTTPHSEHRLGRNVDVRANTAPNAIPHNPAIRNWFVNRCIEIFGQAPLLESPGTTNEHYHVRG